MVLRANPTLRLVNEAVFVVIDAYRTEGDFAEIEDFMPRGRAFAGDRGCLVVAVKMVLIRPVADVLALQQFGGDVRITRSREEGRKPVQTRKDAVLSGIR